MRIPPRFTSAYGPSANRGPHPNAPMIQRSTTHQPLPSAAAVPLRAYFGATAKPHLINDIAHRNPDNSYNVVVEIPAGTNDKWETRKKTGQLYRPIVNGKPRTVQYLSYPGNYGFIPQTLSDPALGGDGDALDAIILGPRTKRGAIVPVRVIGTIRLLDSGEQDDKVIAVPLQGPFQGVHNLRELDQQFPGSLDILKTWFSYYDGAGTTQIQSVADAALTEQIIREGHDSWTKLIKP